MPYTWQPSYGARLGVMKRDDASAPVRWIEIDPCYVFHVANAYDDGATIVMDVVKYTELWARDPHAFEPATLVRWTIDSVSSSVTETRLDERAVEFPRIDERLTGSAHRFIYTVGVGATGEGRTEIRKYDVVSGTSDAHDFGPGRTPGEAVFVPAASGTAEDAGYLMCYVYDAARDRSDYVVLDANAIAAPPLATIALPARVPLGFHGNWIDDAAGVR
jgi:carotenoid cleavage dioxygenase-like enzyme